MVGYLKKHRQYFVADDDNFGNKLGGTTPAIGLKERLSNA